MEVATFGGGGVFALLTGLASWGPVLRATERPTPAASPQTTGYSACPGPYGFRLSLCCRYGNDGTAFALFLTSFAGQYLIQVLEKKKKNICGREVKTA